MQYRLQLSFVRKKTKTVVCRMSINKCLIFTTNRIQLLHRNTSYSSVLINPNFIIVEISCKIKDGGIQQPFRPQLPSDVDKPRVVKLMMECWEENPFKRPTFRTIKKQLKNITGYIQYVWPC